MQITAYDYIKDRAGAGGSLAKLATLIDEARAEAARDGAACLLLDNGDTFQGSPLGGLHAQKPRGTPHPMVACMTRIGFDGGGLGNHDFDHGMESLISCLEQHEMPIVCSNLFAPDLLMVRPSALLTATATAADGASQTLRVGIVSSLPDKTALWSRHHVEAHATFRPPLAYLRKEAALLKNAGADLVVALAHMGLALFDEGDDVQNLVAEVAALDEIDVVIGGHTHLRFPGPDHEGIDGVDCLKGTVLGKPAVQPGASASDLGVIDLVLRQEPGQSSRSIAASEVSLRPATTVTPEHEDILEIFAATHAETRRCLSQEVAQLKQPMNSFFALAHPSPVPALLAAAKRLVIERAVADSALAEMPLLSVSSAPLTGGFDGPDNFLSLPAGTLQRRHVAGMNPYANHVWAVKATGAQIADWLERSALIFNTLTEEDPDQLLVDPRVPGFRYDTIYGLTYTIDPRKPPFFDDSGRPVAGREKRVTNIRWRGEPIRAGDAFLVATTDHRAGGGGLYRTFGNRDIVVKGHAPLQEAVLDYLLAEDREDVHAMQPWSFVRRMGLSAILLTAPEADAHLDDIAHLNPEPCGLTEDGFLKLRLHL